MKKTTKRSSYVKLSLMGAAAFSLAACKQEPPVEASIFKDVAECQAAASQPAATVTATDCETSFAEAQKAHEATAPRYAEQSLCEEQHGGSSCYAQPNPNGGGSIFMPLIAGYLIGNMMSGGNSLANRSSLSSQPIYQTKDKRYSTAGGTFFSSNSGKTTVKPAAFTAAKPTVNAAPMTRASVAKTGGFGRSATATAGRSSFGG
jgi:uncharacterized protein YgiB involved in biofilm formation